MEINKTLRAISERWQRAEQQEHDGNRNKTLKTTEYTDSEGQMEISWS